MRVNGVTVQKLLLGVALLGALAWNLAHSSEIKGLELSSGATGTRAEIALDVSTEFKVIHLKEPDRLVVDLPASALSKGFRTPAPAGVVKSVRTGKLAEGTERIVFDLAYPVSVLKPRLEPGASGPRLVLEWPGDGGSASDSASDQGAASAAATSRLISELTSKSAGVTSPSVSVATVGKPDLPPPAAAKPETRIATGIPTRVVTGQPATMPGAPGVTQPSEAASHQAPIKTLEQVMRGRGMRPLVIAIDPGHGGQDPGASGLNGGREKDITLAISRELARQINATPGLKAYLTRDADVFIPLPQRPRLARKAKADMFVSIHADAAENRNARGSSVYVLSLKGASSQRARWLADKENASDLVGGVRLQQVDNTLSSVLLDLTQSGHMRASEDAAEHVLGGLKQLGKTHKQQIERANFAVLRTSDMPSMLVETAFISNPDEERQLADPAYQRKIAQAVLEGVNTFFTRQPPPGTMYAARAEAQLAASAGRAGAAGGSP